MNEYLPAQSHKTQTIKPLMVIVFVMFVFPVVFSGCSQNTTALYIFRGEVAVPLNVDCPLPCYRGISPRETTQEEAYRLLRNDRDVLSVTDGKGFLTWIEGDSIEGRILIKEDAAAAISLRFPESTYAVESLVEKIGEPTYLHITLPHPRRSPDHQDPQCDVLRLVYENFDMEVVTYQRRSGEVHADHTVQRISLSPTRSQRAILTPYYRRDWQGYQSYCIPVKDIFQE